MNAYYTDDFVLPLPADHRFPMAKYSELRARIMAAGRSDVHLRVPDPATRAQLEHAHTATYLDRVETGALDRREVRSLGFPWSPQLVERSQRSCGATIAACRAALRDGTAVNLAGGTHHAAADRGAAFCVFNDSAVATRTLRAEGMIDHAVIIDCDVHQGEGTATILQNDPTIVTFSIHGARNYPFRKARSDVDVALPDGTSDEVYLSALDAGLHRALDRGRPDLAIFVAGADPYIHDRLGRLAITKGGLERRDALVFDTCRYHGIPVAVSMGGGYAPLIDDIVDIHYHTVMAAAACARSNRDARATRT